MKDLSFKRCLKIGLAAGLGWGLAGLAFNVVGMLIALAIRGMMS